MPSEARQKKIMEKLNRAQKILHSPSPSGKSWFRHCKQDSVVWCCAPQSSAEEMNHALFTLDICVCVNVTVNV